MIGKLRRNERVLHAGYRHRCAMRQVRVVELSGLYSLVHSDTKICRSGHRRHHDSRTAQLNSTQPEWQTAPGVKAREDYVNLIFSSRCASAGDASP